MANAEMTIRLVDATAEEQAALDNTPSFNNGGPVPTPAPKTEAAKTTEAVAKENRVSDAPSSRWSEGLQRLKDALQSLTERFAPKAFQEPIERLINALTPRDEQGNTTIPPPVQTDVEVKPLVDHIVPQQPEEEKQSRKRSERTTDAGAVPEWIDNLMRRSGIGRKALQTYQSTRRNIAMASRALAPAMKRFANSGIGKAIAPAVQKAGGFAKATVGTVAKKLGFPAASAVASGSASNAGGAAVAGAGAQGGVGLAAMATPVAITVASVTAAFAAVAIAAKTLANTFESEAQRLAPYSGAIATAQANTQVNTELNMLDRAQKTDSGLARFETARGNLNNQMEKLWTQILSLLLKMEPALTTGVNALTVMAAEVQRTLAVAEGALAAQKAAAAAKTPGTQDDNDAAKDMARAATNLADAMKASQDAWSELSGRSVNQAQGIDRMLQSVLDTELDAKGNVKKKHGGAHGGKP